MATAAKKSIVKKIRQLTIGEMADEIEVLQEELAQVEALVKDKNEQIKLKIEVLTARMEAEGLTASKGTLATVERKTQDVYTPKDWTAIYAYIQKTGAFELLHKRLTNTAIAERLENNDPVPGVEKFTRYYTVVKAVKGKV